MVDNAAGPATPRWPELPPDVLRLLLQLASADGGNAAPQPEAFATTARALRLVCSAWASGVAEAVTHLAAPPTSCSLSLSKPIGTAWPGASFLDLSSSPVSDAQVAQLASARCLGSLRLDARHLTLDGAGGLCDNS
jgi:hypothetical protein